MRARNRYTRETADGGFWEQAFILTAPDGQPFDRYGGAVALSADGYTAMVGSRAYWTGIVNTDGSSASNVTNGRPGKAYVYRRTSQLGNDWELIAVLTGGLDMSSNLVDEFGYSLKLSADGDVALVGARKAAVDGAQQQGAAYVFSNLLQATDLETNFPPPPPPPPSVPIPPSVLGSQQSPPPPSTTGPVNSSPSPVPRGDMPPPAPPSSSGSSTVGIAVGVAIGVAAAIAIGVGIFFCIKKSQASSGAKYSVPQNEDDYGKPITQATNASPPPRPQQASYAPPATAPAADGKV